MPSLTKMPRSSLLRTHVESHSNNLGVSNKTF